MAGKTVKAKCAECKTAPPEWTWEEGEDAPRSLCTPCMISEVETCITDCYTCHFETSLPDVKGELGTIRLVA